jgi:hypothetical protein
VIFVFSAVEEGSNMIIEKVSVTYGELRSTGYPSFSNRRFEVTLSAELHLGETAYNAIDRLYGAAKLTVNRYFDQHDRIPSQESVNLSEMLLNEPRKA